MLKMQAALSLAGLMLDDDSSISTTRSRPLAPYLPLTHCTPTPGRVISPLSMDRVYLETNTRRRALAIRCRLPVA